MDSIHKRLRLLEKDLLAVPVRISAYHDLPFAIFCYPEQEEYPMRKEMQRLKIRLENRGKQIHLLSLGQLFWEAVRRCDSVENIVTLEKKLGFNRVTETVRTYLSDPDFAPLPNLVLERIRDGDPEKDVIFLYRAAAMAPGFYRMSVLLNELQGKTLVPLILFYPGRKDGETQLRFMGMEGRQAISSYNYRVKIY